MSKREWMLQAALAWYGRGYSIEQRISAELLSSELAQVYDAICAATPTVADEGWVEHDGDVSKAPPEGRMVEAIDREGSSYNTTASDLTWDHLGGDYDIVRWRYV